MTETKERLAGRDLDAEVAEKVMGETLSVPRERAMAIVGALYVRETGPVFKLDVHGFDVSVKMPAGEDIDGHASDLNFNSRYLRHAVAELLTYPNEIAELVEKDLAECRLIPRPYSADISAAWQVVEKSHYVEITKDLVMLGREFTVEFWLGDERGDAAASTLPLAICLAALAATPPATA